MSFHCSAVISQATAQRADAGVGADDVDAAELGQALLDHGDDLIEVAHVGHALDGTAAQRLDARDRLVEIVAASTARSRSCRPRRRRRRAR